MKKPFFKQLSMFLILVGLSVPLAKAQQSNQHMLWKIEKGDELQGYLLGSIHIMKPEAYPLDAIYQQAFEKSDVVVFELNFDSLMTNMLPLVQQLAMYPPGKSIEDVLSIEAYTLLQNTLDSLGLPAARFNRFEPWFLSMSLPSIQMKRAGYAGTSGIDMHFFSEAKKTGKKIIGLETAKYQLNIFDDLPLGLQKKYLKFTLEQTKKGILEIDELTKAWLHGNANRIEEIIQAKMKKNLPRLYKNILTERNHNWIPKIEALLAKDETPIIIVGAGHMVGQEGLISLLEEKGYEIEQM